MDAPAWQSPGPLRAGCTSPPWQTWQGSLQRRLRAGGQTAQVGLVVLISHHAVDMAATAGQSLGRGKGWGRPDSTGGC